MKSFQLATLLAIFMGFQALGQDKKALKFAKTITKEDLYSRLEVLTSDSLEGRETGQPGQKKAAAFIASEFRRYGLQPIVKTNGTASYFQEFPLVRSQWQQVYVKAGSSVLQNGETMLYMGSATTSGEEQGEAVFIGNIDDAGALIKSGSLKGKVAAVYAPDSRMWTSIRRQFAEADIKGLLVFGGETDQQFKNVVGRYKNYVTGARLGLESQQEGGLFVFVVAPGASQLFFGKSVQELTAAGATAVPPTCQLSFSATKSSEQIQTENVLGFLEGTDKKEEVLVVTAHYDHLGKQDDVIYRGADDDGSGTSGVLEIAQAFAEAKRKGNGPRRSILFMTVTGEEKGLLGSEYYTNHPVIPLSQTVANLNIDMIGRVDDAHAANENYIYVIGSDKLSQDLHRLSEGVNNKYTNLAFDYTYNDEADPNRFYYRSDHYNFAKNNVPIIFYFNGVHADYHRPTDTIEKIAFGKMVKVTQLVFFTAWEIANREERIRLD